MSISIPTDTTTTIAGAIELATTLIADYRRNGYALARLGSAAVRIDTCLKGSGESRREQPNVTVDWPGIGAKTPAEAAAFAAALTYASQVAAATERLLAAPAPEPEPLVPSEEAVGAARAEIGHRTDGPITAFVLTARATRYAHKTGQHRAAAEALTELLEEYGFARGRGRRVPTGS